jgi:hypothetical protein
MALAIALFALVVVGALVATAFFIARLEQQSGRNVRFAYQATEAAEAGLSDAIGTLTQVALQGMPVGGTLPLPDITMGNGVSANAGVVRLTGTLYLIRSAGHRADAAGNELATRTLGSLVKLVSDSVSGTNVVRRVRERSWVEMW